MRHFRCSDLCFLFFFYFLDILHAHELKSREITQKEREKMEKQKRSSFNKLSNRQRWGQSNFSHQVEIQDSRFKKLHCLTHSDRRLPSVRA